MKKENSIKVLGNISPNKQRQWGIVVSGGGISPAEVSSQYKWSLCVVKKITRETIQIMAINKAQI